jgi:hypothetical protein
VTGLPFEFAGSLYRPFAPSLDRINAAQGYSLGNVRLVAVIVNAALNQWGDAAFWKMVDAAAGRQRGTPRFEATRENVYNQHGDPNGTRTRVFAVKGEIIRLFSVRLRPPTSAHIIDFNRFLL